MGRRNFPKFLLLLHLKKKLSRWPRPSWWQATPVSFLRRRSSDRDTKWELCQWPRWTMSGKENHEASLFTATRTKSTCPITPTPSPTAGAATWCKSKYYWGILNTSQPLSWHNSYNLQEQEQEQEQEQGIGRVQIFVVVELCSDQRYSNNNK